jgi:magnesium chelatase family protein
MVRSVTGILEGASLHKCPLFREPLHSASQVALTGCGQRAKPGEVNLAHRGVLFLDELPARPWKRCASRWMPAVPPWLGRPRTSPIRAFLDDLCHDPCRCGRFGNAGRECGRAPRCSEDYQGRVSGPLLDRIAWSFGSRRSRRSSCHARRQARAAPSSPPAWLRYARRSVRGATQTGRAGG